MRTQRRAEPVENTGGHGYLDTEDVNGGCNLSTGSTGSHECISGVEPEGHLQDLAGRTGGTDHKRARVRALDVDHGS